MKRVAGWSFALALSIGVGLSSLAVAGQLRSPALTIAVGFPPVAVARDAAALRLFAARREREPRAAVGENERRLARQAYRSEPLSVSSITLLALSMTGRSDAQKRQALLEQAGRLTRRSTLLNTTLIESAGRRGDNRAFFAWMSRVMLTSSSGRQVYAAAMAEATAREDAVDALVPVLGARPRWADEYWRLVVGRSASLANAAKLRAALSRAPWSQTDVTSTDEALVRQLVTAGQFDAASQLSATLAPRGRAATARTLLRNGGFAAAPSLPPFDWQLSVLGNLGASIDLPNRQLVISAIAGARGAAARQLVELQAGDYVLGWSAASDAPLSPGLLSLQLRCAERNNAAAIPVSVPLTTGKRRQALVSIGGSCKWHWLSIDVVIPDDSPGIDVYVRDLLLSAATMRAGS